MKLGCSISLVCQLACAFFGLEELENFADGKANSFDRSGGKFSQEVFELGEDLLDGVQVGRVFGQEEELGACRTDELTHDFASVAAEIVHDYDVARTKRRKQNFLYIDPKAVAIDRAIEKPWRLDAVMALGRQERHGLAAAVWNLGGRTLAARRPSPQGRHLGPGTGLVVVYQAVRLDAIFIFDPLGSPPCDVGTIAFASHHAFFEAELLGVNELPYRTVINLQPALSELGDQAAQGEVSFDSF